MRNTDANTGMAANAAAEMTDPSRAQAAPTFVSTVWEFVQTILLAVLLFLLIRNVIQNFRIDGISMEPNFHNGQFLIVNRFAYCPGLHLEIKPLGLHWNKSWCIHQPKRGDVIVFEYPNDPSRDFIKRVVGLPGETVEVRSGKVYIDGLLMPEPFGPNPAGQSTAPVTVGEGQLFVMGDNRNNSSDSRYWGPLPEEYIIGKALVSYWPPRYWSIIPHYDLTDLSASSS